VLSNHPEASTALPVHRTKPGPCPRVGLDQGLMRSNAAIRAWGLMELAEVDDDKLPINLTGEVANCLERMQTNQGLEAHDRQQMEKRRRWIVVGLWLDCRDARQGSSCHLFPRAPSSVRPSGKHPTNVNGLVLSCDKTKCREPSRRYFTGADSVPRPARRPGRTGYGARAVPTRGARYRPPGFS
jgi:hypothetical protein